MKEREREREREAHLDLERLVDLDRVLFLLLELSFSFTAAVLPTTTASGAAGGFCSRRARLASLTFLRASSTSLLVSEGDGPCGFTIAFLLWFTLCLGVCVRRERVTEEEAVMDGKNSNIIVREM